MLKHNIDFVYCILPEIIRSFLCTLSADCVMPTFHATSRPEEFILVVHQIKLQYISGIVVKM